MQTQQRALANIVGCTHCRDGCQGNRVCEPHVLIPLSVFLDNLQAYTRSQKFVGWPSFSESMSPNNNLQHFGFRKGHSTPDVVMLHALLEMVWEILHVNSGFRHLFWYHCQAMRTLCARTALKSAHVWPPHYRALIRVWWRDEDLLPASCMSFQCQRVAAWQKQERTERGRSGMALHCCHTNHLL